MTIMFIFIGKQTFTVSISDLLAVSSDLFLNKKPSMMKTFHFLAVS
jgi:hypothetical protein